MSGYIIIGIFLLSLFCFFIDFSNVSNKTKRNLFYTIIIVLFIVSASKDANTSFDTNNYINHFFKSKTLGSYVPFSENWYEPGYILLVAIIKTITNNYNLLFGVISMISLLILYKICKKYSPFPLASLFIYISLFYFKRDIITIRYGLSALLLLYAIILSIENRTYKSIWFYILSFSFHYSSLAGLTFLPFYYFFRNKDINNAEFIDLICLPLSFVGINILFIIILFSHVLPQEIGYGITKGIAYLDEEKTGGLKQIIPYIPFVLFCHKILKCHPTNKMLKGLYLTLLLAIFYMIELNQAESFARVNQLFLTSIVILIPILIKQSNVLKNKRIIISYTLIFCVYMFIRICFFNSGGFINVYW